MCPFYILENLQAESQYAESTLQGDHIELNTQTTIKEVHEKSIIASIKGSDGSSIIKEIPYGLLIWAAGNAPRPLVRDLISKIPAQLASRAGLLVGDHLLVEGCDGIWYCHSSGELRIGRLGTVLLPDMHQLRRLRPNK